MTNVKTLNLNWAEIPATYLKQKCYWSNKKVKMFFLVGDMINFSCYAFRFFSPRNPEVFFLDRQSRQTLRWGFEPAYVPAKVFLHCKKQLECVWNQKEKYKEVLIPQS